MGATRPPRSRLAETRPTLFWLALTATPLGFLAFSGASRAVRALRERAARVATSPETDLRAKVSAADRAARTDDARALEAATARALEAATVAYADVNVRDARGGEAARRLVDAGVDEALAGEIEAVLADSQAARFSPEAPDLASARGRWAKAKGAIHELRRGA